MLEIRMDFVEGGAPRRGWEFGWSNTNSMYGKKYGSLCLTRALARRHFCATFVAGQKWH